jgi:hypothetical protein
MVDQSMINSLIPYPEEPAVGRTPHPPHQSSPTNDRTEVPPDVAEMALARTVGDKV